MSNEEKSLIDIGPDDPLNILGKVEFRYASHVQVNCNSWDIRIALGDRRPPTGEIEPVIGIIMSHEHAKAFLEVLSAQIRKLERMKGHEIEYRLNLEAAKEEEAISE